MKENQNILLFVIITILLGYISYDSFYRGADHNKLALKSFRYDPQKVSTFDIPENLNFAGESVPVNKPDIRERFDREVHINTYYHSSTIFMIKRANKWFPVIEPILQKNGIPEDFKYLAVIESSLTNVVSPKNAVGFWQLLKGTAKEWGLEVNNEVDERYHPVKSAEVACKFIKKSYNKFGNWTNAAASYNMGVFGLNRRLEQQQVKSYYDLLLNEETARYVFRALALKEIMEHPQKYGYDIPEEHLYYNESLKEITITTTIPDLVEFSNGIGINYKTLKLYNPWLRNNKLTVGKNSSYSISIPESVSDNLIQKYHVKLNESENFIYGDSESTVTGSPKDLQSRNTSPY